MKMYNQICLECGKSYETSRKNGKFCSRSCYAKEDSRRKIEKFKNNPHHNLGRKASKEECEMRSKQTKSSWKDVKIRKARTDGITNYNQTHENPAGWSLESNIKRNLSIEKNGGHNLAGKYGTRPCDLTFLKNHGITFAEFGQRLLHNTKKTKPELLSEKMLLQINKDFKPQYKFKNRYFDFGLESEKLLIEIDGDYWHSKGIVYEDMNNQQRNTFRNDIYKNDLVNKSNWKLIRIWVSELEKLSASDLHNILYGKENKN